MFVTGDGQTINECTSLLAGGVTVQGAIHCVEMIDEHCMGLMGSHEDFFFESQRERKTSQRSFLTPLRNTLLNDMTYLCLKSKKDFE